MSDSIFGSVDGLNESQIKSFEALFKEFEKVDEELETEQAALLRKYQKVRLPIYKKQRELVKSIPGFWKQVFESHPDVMQALDADDIDILGKVTDVSLEENDDGSSTAISFHFENGNPHFTNTTLKKEVIRKKEGGFQLKHTPVDWIKGRKRKADPSDDGLFHSWFQFDDPEEASLFDIIKDDLLPKSLRYFAGVADDEAMMLSDDAESEAGADSEDLQTSGEEEPSPKKTKKH